MIIREGQRKVIMPDRIGGRERERGILCAGEETETATPGAPARPRKTANPRNYLEVSCFRLSRTFETSGINSVPYYRFCVTGSTERLAEVGRAPSSIASRSIDSISLRLESLLETVPVWLTQYEQMCRILRRWVVERDTLISINLHLYKCVFVVKMLFVRKNISFDSNARDDNPVGS